MNSEDSLPENGRKHPGVLDELYGEQLSTKGNPQIDYLIRLNLEKIRKKRLQFDLPVIGITGSSGKTITKSMLTQVLSPNGPVLETPYDCQTSYKVTSTIRNLTDKHKFAVIELGIHSQENIDRAIYVTEPNIGIVTNVGDAHLAYLRNRFNVASTKSALIKKLPEDGFAILNKDDELTNEMIKISSTKNIVRFGLSRKADFFASDIKSLGPEGTRFKVNYTFDVKMKIFSISDIYNALSAISCARVLGIPFDDIFERLSQFTLPEGRGRVLDLDGRILIDDTYDKSVNSARKAAQTLLGFRDHSKKLGLILGDLYDFEGNREEAFRSLGHYLSVFSFDYFIFIGKYAELFAEGVRIIPHGKQVFVFETIEEAAATLANTFKPLSTFLLKGDIGCETNFFLDQIVQQVA